MHYEEAGSQSADGSAQNDHRQHGHAHLKETDKLNTADAKNYLSALPVRQLARQGATILGSALFTGNLPGCSAARRPTLRRLTMLNLYARPARVLLTRK